MKKKFLAIALVMFMFPIALLLTACGGGEKDKLQIGKNYVFDKVEITWASEEEKVFLLDLWNVAEESEFIVSMQQTIIDTKIVFNSNGTVVSKNGEEAEITLYYTLDEETNIITIYEDQEKSQVQGTIKLVGDTLVQEQVIMEEFNTKLKITYKIQGATTPGDGDQGGEEGGEQLQIGVKYVFDSFDLLWHSNDEKTQFLSEREMSEQDFIAATEQTLSGTYMVFKENGTVLTNAGDGVQGVTYYYVVEDSTIKVYENQAKTQLAATMQILGDTFVHEEAIANGMQSTIKMIYKVSEDTPGDGPEDIPGDGQEGEAQLQVGATYSFESLQINWASDEAKQTYLSSMEVTEPQLLSLMSQMMESTSLVFNANGTVNTMLAGEGSETYYYSVEDTTIKIFIDQEKTQQTATITLSGTKVKQTGPLDDGFGSTVVITYSVQEDTPGDGPEDIPGDGPEDTPEGGQEGEAQLQVGATYSFESLQINWASDEAKQTYLSSMEVTEPQLLSLMSQMMEGTSLVFNANGTVNTLLAGEGSETYYYSVEDTTIKIFIDQEKTQQTATITLSGTKVKQTGPLDDGFGSTVVITYSVQENTPGDGPEDIPGDGPEDTPEGGQEGEAQLQIGREYTFYNVAIDWANEQEKQEFLELTQQTEQQIIAIMANSFEGATLLFNADGTLVTTVSGGQSQTYYYVVDGNTINVYEDQQKTIFSVKLEFSNATIIQSNTLGDGMDSVIKVTYKI